MFLGLCHRAFRICKRDIGALSTPTTEFHVDPLILAFEDTLRTLAAEGWSIAQGSGGA
jgi:hypothetical protein